MHGLSVLFIVLRLREKAQELWDWLRVLEDEKYDHEQRINRQKYDASIRAFFSSWRHRPIRL